MNPQSDILYLESKHAGSWWYSSKPGAYKCIHIEKGVVPEIVEEYLNSKEWYARNYGDYLLYEAANRSLELTISALGRERFQDALQEFRKLKER